ncbi:MAG: hypothetical protein DDT39_00007 [Firmicutes bacterium]|nr:hypothetical protein [candidate division NPL-UPA2 bacterium]
MRNQSVRSKSHARWGGGLLHALPRDCVFVFGSNLAGRHGQGAAHTAALHFGAQYGVGEGLTGRAYALPTKNAQVQTLPLTCIAEHVDTFLRFASANPHTRFFVTKIGTGLAGYSPNAIAPLFAHAGQNVLLPDQFIEHINHE